MKERPESKRPKMPLSQRAKQFAPFDALTGLSERLKQAEEEHSRALNSRTLRYSGDNTYSAPDADTDSRFGENTPANIYGTPEMPEE